MLPRLDLYPPFAARHGLRISPALTGSILLSGGIQLDGELGGRRVAVRRHIGKHPWVSFRTPLSPPLDLGLSVRPSDVLETVRAWIGAPDVEVGDGPFDDAFAIQADEPGRARALLGPALRQAALALAPKSMILADDEVVVHHRLGLGGAREDATLLEGSLEALLTLADAVDGARRGTPPAADLAPLLPALDAFARARDLSVAFDAPARLEGALQDRRVWILARRRKKGVHELELAARFERPLGFHFGVTSARTGIGTWLQGEDVQIGEAAFDRAFDVHGDEPDRLRAILDADVRASLLELATGRWIRLETTGLYLSDGAADFAPEVVSSTLERMVDLVKFVERRTHGAPEAGYR